MSDQTMKISENFHTERAQNNIISYETKRISALVPIDYISQMTKYGYSQTTAVIKGLEILFSDDYNNISSYKDIISSYERKFEIQKAQLSELEMIKKELERVHNLLTDQKELDKAHMAQVQSLINEVHLRDETLLSSKEQLLLFAQERKDPWWKKLLK